jgi:hypothetical protein
MLNQIQKTWLIILFIIFICTYNLLSQSDTCNCGKWSSTAVTINWTGVNCTQDYDTIYCGEEVKLNIAEGTSINGSFNPYICTPKSCSSKYIWQITGPTNFQNPGYPMSTFSRTFSFSPSITGTYTLTITPYCDDTTCTPCIIKFNIVKIVKCCECKKWTNPKVIINWKGINCTEEYDTTYCGDEVKLYIAEGTSISGSFSEYICMPESCFSKYIWKITGPANFQSPGYPNPTTSRTFSFSPTLTGTYTLTITPYCGDTTCTPCIIKFNIVKIVKCCECGKWTSKAVTINWTGANCKQDYDTTYCREEIKLNIAKGTSINGSFNPCICTPKSCSSKYIWKITGPANFKSPGYPNPTASRTFSFSPTLTGTYTLTIIPVCGDNKCEPCIIKFNIVKIVKCCECGKWTSPKVTIKWNDERLKDASIKCGNESFIIEKLCYNSKIVISFSPYICKPQSCPTKYIWIIKGPQISIKNPGYPIPVTSDNFYFKATRAGKYKLTITPI